MGQKESLFYDEEAGAERRVPAAGASGAAPLGTLRHSPAPHHSSAPPPDSSLTIPPRAQTLPPLSAMLLLDTEFTTLTLEGSIVRFERTGARYPDVETLTADLNDMDAALSKVRLRPRGLLIDMRKVQGRNDGEFEKTLAPRRARILQSFDAIAFVMATHVGRLQTKRHADNDKSHSEIFDNPNDAAVWLKQELYRMRASASVVPPSR